MFAVASCCSLIKLLCLSARSLRRLNAGVTPTSTETGDIRHFFLTSTTLAPSLSPVANNNLLFNRFERHTDPAYRPIVFIPHRIARSANFHFDLSPDRKRPPTTLAINPRHARVVSTRFTKQKYTPRLSIISSNLYRSIYLVSSFIRFVRVARERDIWDRIIGIFRS